MADAKDAKPDNDPMLLAELNGLTKAQRSEIAGSVGPILETQRQRIEYAETRRGALATVAGVVLAAGLAGLLTVAKTADWNYFPAWLGLLCATCGLVMTGVGVLVIYARQTNWNYPFKSVSNAWKHFYWDAIPGAGEPKVPWHTRQSEAFKTASARGYEAIRTGYVQRIVSLKDPAVSLAQDIEQA